MLLTVAAGLFAATLPTRIEVVHAVFGNAVLPAAANATTLVGALCFFVGAVLLLPESAD